MKKKKIVIFSGAGMSAESGLKTFRDSGGLWEEYRIEEVATPEAWASNPSLVLEFYNKRRAQAHNALPNNAHHAIAKLETEYDVQVITQNVDDLHERAGSSRVLHLHGELDKVRSVLNSSFIKKMNGKPIELGDTCNQGGQLRPHIVWFGEEVPAMDSAIEMVNNTDILIIIGTSLQVYPAAGLVYALQETSEGFYIDPNAEETELPRNFRSISSTASEGIQQIIREKLL